MLTLMVLQGPDKGRRFELPDKPTLVGRESRQLPLSDNTVSRRHAELLPGEGEEGGWTLRDLGSSNGTYINGLRVTNRYSLKLGDQIRVGRTLMVYGAQPGITRGRGGDVSLTGEEAGLDASIMHTVPSNDDSMVLSVPEPAAAAMTNLKVLYQLGAALGSSFDIQQVLEVVMDLVFEHVKADRGIILLVDEVTREVAPKVVRTRVEQEKLKEEPKALKNDDTHTPSTIALQPADGNPISDDSRAGSTNTKPEDTRIHASRTIINHVIENGEGVLSANAMTDQRFSAGKSIHAMSIHSALCVPIKARKLDGKGGDEILGVIYIDSSVKNHTYVPDQLRLLTAIGLQAGLAIQNAKLYKQGLQAERLAAIGETTAALSHSIKNILQALRGGADVVEIGIRSNNISQVAKGWRVAERNLQKIYNLTMNLLAYSRPREPALQLVNPRALINECVELIAPSANEKGVMVVADVDKDQPAVPLDPDGMHQVMMNLLGNALDAVEPQRGLIRVVGQYDSDSRSALIEVIDNGAGIPPPMMKHVFELFHSTKGNRGTGLGLAVAKKIIDEHEGSITVKSAPGEGTSFTLRLPVYHLNDSGSTHGPK